MTRLNIELAALKIKKTYDMVTITSLKECCSATPKLHINGLRPKKGVQPFLIQGVKFYSKKQFQNSFHYLLQKTLLEKVKG